MFFLNLDCKTCYQYGFLDTDNSCKPLTGFYQVVQPIPCYNRPCTVYYGCNNTC